MVRKPIKLFVADGQNIVRKSICALLEQVDDIEVVGETASGEEAFAQATMLGLDVILMDLLMPKIDGAAAIQQILARLVKSS